ncbi:peptidylprolyl isomerase [Planococcus kocurii]|uniref:peptidylprolyl isomerase n=1 Tax=Planococcus kocurii TaxID=1374 RepID=UPI003CFD1EAB
MKKILLLILVSVLLSACDSNDSELSFSEIETVPDNIQALIEPTSTLQLISEGESVAYIVYQTKGTVATDLEAQEDTVNVKLDVSNSDNNDIKQHVYKLTLEPNHEIIDVYINGESTSFDNISGL